MLGLETYFIGDHRNRGGTFCCGLFRGMLQVFVV